MEKSKGCTELQICVWINKTGPFNHTECERNSKWTKDSLACPDIIELQGKRVRTFYNIDISSVFFFTMIIRLLAIKTGKEGKKRGK